MKIKNYSILALLFFGLIHIQQVPAHASGFRHDNGIRNSRGVRNSHRVRANQLYRKNSLFSLNTKAFLLNQDIYNPYFRQNNRRYNRGFFKRRYNFFNRRRIRNKILNNRRFGNGYRY